MRGGGGEGDAKGRSEEAWTAAIRGGEEERARGRKEGSHVTSGFGFRAQSFGRGRSWTSEARFRT